MTIRGPAPKPCESCPYRQDVPSGVWSAQEYDKLPAYDADMPYQPMEVFMCHQNERFDPRSRLCAGWVATHGAENLLAIRIGVTVGTIDFDSVAGYTTDVPLFESGMGAAEHGERDIEFPGEEARALCAKIAANREDVRWG